MGDDTSPAHNSTRRSSSQMAAEASRGPAHEKCTFNEEFKFILLPISYGAVCVVGLFLNSCSLWLFVFRMRPWNATSTYMFHLAISDTLYILSLPSLVYYYARRNNWPFGEWPCKLVRFLFYTNQYSSILFLTCISVHRYLGVCHPILSLTWLKARHARLVCVGVWLLVAVCLAPNLFFVTISARGNGTLCHDTTKPEAFERYVYYSSSVMALLFGIPFLVIVLCCCQTARRLWKPHPLGPPRPVPLHKRRSIKMIVIVLLVFAVSFLPFHLTRTVYYAARLLKADCRTLNAVNVTYKITRPLASANSCIDPILYFLTGEPCRGRLHRALVPRAHLALTPLSPEGPPAAQGLQHKPERRWPLRGCL